MRPILARNDIVTIGRASATIRTEAGKVKAAELFMLDVSETAIRSKRTEATSVVRAWW